MDCSDPAAPADTGGIVSDASPVKPNPNPVKGEASGQRKWGRWAFAGFFLLGIVGIVLDLVLVTFDGVPQTADVVFKGDKIHTRAEILMSSSSILHSYHVRECSCLFCMYFSISTYSYFCAIVFPVHRL
jgi:hypothetical protein